MTAIAHQALALAADLQPLIERHDTFPEIFGEADGLAALQAALWRAAVLFGGQPSGADEGEPF